MSVDDDRSLVYACRCLNVQLRRRDAQQNVHPTYPGSSSDYEPLYVGEDGIEVTHNELTMRSRSAIFADANVPGTRYQQTSLTCLACDTVAYRITTEVMPEMEAKEGPVMPSEDWAERDTMTGKSGWIEVHLGHGGCISGEQILSAKTSPTYSQHFAIALPNASHVLPTSPPSTVLHTRFSVPLAHNFLPSLPPFLPPPPFTPSHPIFLHLSKVATASSSNARMMAESRVEVFAKRQLAQLETEETELKAELEHLWRNVREGLKKIERERDANLLSSVTRRKSLSPGRRTSSVQRGSPMVCDFIPSTYQGPRMSRSSVPRHSALSASLATSSFHHPRARQEEANGAVLANDPAPGNTSSPSPPPYVSNPPSPGNSSGSSSTTSPARIMSRSLKRNMDESNDAAVTFQWSVLKEQEAAREAAKEKAKKEQEAVTNIPKVEVKRDEEFANKTDVGTLHQTESKRENEDASTDDGVIDNGKKDAGKKGRRKVTFDVKPNVVTIKREISAEEEGGRTLQNGDDLIFDIDDNDVETGGPDENLDIQLDEREKSPPPILPLYESPQEHSRSSRRPVDLMNAGLPQSFAALRPASLPVPSNVRPPIRSNARGKAPERDAPHPSPTASPSPNPRRSRNNKLTMDEESPLNEATLAQRAELMKLVAAGAPSHRGAWSRDSNSWKIFDRRSNSSTIMEEGENEEDETPESMAGSSSNGTKVKRPDWTEYRPPALVSSLPVPMAPIHQLASNGRQSFQPKTSLSDRPGVLVPPLSSVVEEDESNPKKSAEAHRREAYAERDRVRARDPGILDFAEDEEESSSLDMEDDLGHVSASKARQNTLKILRAGSSVPAAGLWRSLAS